MKVLIAGVNGQVGQSLIRTAPSGCIAEVYPEEQLDLTKRAHIEQAIAATRPDTIINAAAYTAVDRAETNRETAFAVNADAVGTLAELCDAANIRLLHISTDYVFDGLSTVAYAPDAQTKPINVYGASKLAGEQRLAATSTLDWALVRTAWVYAPWGNNFVLTMLRLFRERGGASVVSDQIGAPTSALSLARFLWRMALSPCRGTLHYTDAGVASWYDFAVAIGEEALAIGLLSSQPAIKPITTAEYPTPAKRPHFSLLASRTSVESVGAEQPHWRVALREVIREVAREKRSAT